MHMSSAFPYGISLSGWIGLVVVKTCHYGSIIPPLAIGLGFGLVALAIEWDIHREKGTESKGE